MLRGYIPDPLHRPVGPVIVHPMLAGSAVSLYPLSDRFLGCTDYKRANILTFGTTTAAPAWGDRRHGRCLTFDGGDTAINSSLTATVSAFPTWVAGGCVDDTDGSGATIAPIGLSGVGDASTCNFGVRRLSASATWNVSVNNLSAGTPASINTVPAITGQATHFAAITRSATGHTVFQDGQKFTSSTNIGSTFSGWSRFSVGVLARNTPVNHMTGGVFWAAFGTTDPGDVFLRDLSINPWKYLYAPQQQYSLSSAGQPTMRRFGQIMRGINVNRQPGVRIS